VVVLCRAFLVLNALAAVTLAQGCRNHPPEPRSAGQEPPPATEPTQGAPGPAPDPAEAPSAPDVSRETSRPPFLEPDQVRVAVSPELLEVLEPATIRLAAHLPDMGGLSCRWILAEGADRALEGCEAVAELPEVMGDVEWILVVSGEQGELLRRTGRIPLERLPVTGAAPEPASEPSRQDAPPAVSTVAVSWTLEPQALEVLQDTPVRMVAQVDADLRCRWDPGGGEEPLEGCAVSHVFREAHADRVVTLTGAPGDEVVYSAARSLPLERLPVTPEALAAGALPACGEDCRRLVVASVTGDDGLDRPFRLVTETGAAALVLFLHAPLPEAAALEDLARHLGARGAGLLPVACSEGLPEASLARLLTSHALAAGLVLQSDDRELAVRSSFQWGPAFLAALPRRAELPDEAWLADQLDAAAMFGTRVLLSCLAFDRLTETTPSLLPSPYRQYEKMRRGGVDLFVSGGHLAFFPGTYGNLRTLAPGRLGAGGAPLLGLQQGTGPVAALVDLGSDRIRRIVGIVPAGDGWAVLPEEGLPDKVGVYRRWR